MDNTQTTVLTHIDIFGIKSKPLVGGKKKKSKNKSKRNKSKQNKSKKNKSKKNKSKKNKSKKNIPMHITMHKKIMDSMDSKKNHITMHKKIMNSYQLK